MLSLNVNRLLTCAALALLLQGCVAMQKSFPGNASSLSPAIPPTHSDSREDDNVMGWHSASFFIDWPADHGPDWHTDALLAHGLFKNVLHTHSDQIALWRFHRRALRDATGHRFSFHFYSDQRLANTVFHEIEQHADTRQLLSTGIATRLHTSGTTGETLPRIKDTSDSAWSEPLQASWPYFAMGVSRSWLELIDQIAVTLPPLAAKESIEKRLAFYRSVNDQVTQHWRQEGGHAYLHHLNALFGYEDIIVREQRTTRF